MTPFTKSIAVPMFSLTAPLLVASLNVPADGTGLLLMTLVLGNTVIDVTAIRRHLNWRDAIGADPC